MRRILKAIHTPEFNVTKHRPYYESRGIKTLLPSFEDRVSVAYESINGKGSLVAADRKVAVPPISPEGSAPDYRSVFQSGLRGQLWLIERFGERVLDMPAHLKRQIRAQMRAAKKVNVALLK